MLRETKEKAAKQVRINIFPKVYFERASVELAKTKQCLLAINFRW